MSPPQERMANPYGMDEACPRCDELVETRSTIVHGYGDVSADFLFVLESPSQAADKAGHPIIENNGDITFIEFLDAVGFLTEASDEVGEPILNNAFVTHLTRCHHPDRNPTETEIANCEPFLNAEIRTINPEIMVPVGERVLRTLAMDYTTINPADLVIDEVHATELRGRGFELIPIREPTTMEPTHFEAAVDQINGTLNRDYRQTKGRRSR